MRIVSVLVLCVFALGLIPGAGMAEKGPKPTEPVWHFNLDSRATYPEAEPNDTCPGQPIACGDVVDPAAINTAGDVDWYTFTIDTITPITIGTDLATGCTTSIDTYIHLYDSDCATQLAYDDDSGPGAYSLITAYNPVHTGTFNIKVRHYSTSGTGCYKLFLTCAPPPTGACCLAGGICTILTQANCGTQGGTYQGDNTSCTPNPCPQPPPNDTCAGAFLLDRCSSGVIAGTLAAATNNYDPGVPGPSCTGYSAAGKDVVYVMNLVAGDAVHLVYTTPNHDGSMYIVTDCANVSASCVIGEDDPEPETINWVATATGTYYLIVDAFTSNGGADFTLEWSITCPPPTGACCHQDGSCTITAQADCDGMWMGPGIVCDPNPCPQVPAACCFSDGRCQILTAQECTMAGGMGGFGLLCDPNPCTQPPVACCYQDGHCEFITADDCVRLGGMPQGFGSVCDPNPCPQPSMACCFTDGHCEYVTEARCLELGGAPQGLGTLCDPNLCQQPPATGACCLDDQGHCEVMTEGACLEAGGQYQGDDSVCDPNPCPIVPSRGSTWGEIKGKYH
jgi:hypothetical protein